MASECVWNPFLAPLKHAYVCMYTHTRITARDSEGKAGCGIEHKHVCVCVCVCVCIQRGEGGVRHVNTNMYMLAYA